MNLVTHNGRFHYDEVLASAILKKIYKNVNIKRTRDMSLIAKGDIVYDVGGVFDPLTKRFDHHHHTFHETFSSEYKYKLSSSGLIYKYYHKELFAQYGINLEDPLYDSLVNKVYKDFFLGADCIDNGVNIYGDILPRSIYDMVDIYNDDNDCMSDKQYDNFLLALDLVYNDLDRYIKFVKSSWFDKYKILEGLIRQNDDYILDCDEYFGCDLILDIEKKYDKNIIYMVFPSDGNYKVRAINVNKNSFESKLPLKKEWRGKREDELIDLIEGATFVHASGFIGINKTKAGAIKMCRETYENSK